MIIFIFFSVVICFSYAIVGYRTMVGYCLFSQLLKEISSPYRKKSCFNVFAVIQREDSS